MIEQSYWSSFKTVA
jgi:hypothetical protein